MFRNMSNERHFPGGQKPTSSAGHGIASAALDSQESSWIGLLSAVSRPALSFLQKYVTGRPRTPALSNRGAAWVGGEPKAGFDVEEREFLRHLDDMVPAHQLTDVGGLLEQRVPWLTTESLRELGIHSVEDVNLRQTENVSSLRTYFSHVVWSSSQEIRPTTGKNWAAEGKPRWWWGSFWGGEESSQSALLSWAEEGTVTGELCPQQPPTETKAAETAPVFVQSSNRDPTLGENTGPIRHNDQLANNGGLLRVQNPEGSTPHHRLCISLACTEVALLTPDQDNGYSSLEEEQVQLSRLYVVKVSGEETGNCVKTEMEEETTEEGESASHKVDKEEIVEEDQTSSQEAQSGGGVMLSTPQCQNKAIAFIMGCPCSDDDSVSSDMESSDDEDDGFNSEGSSDLFESTDEEKDSDSDDEADSEAEHPWSSLCQSLDPYNPQNFTASLHTGSTLPIPTSSTPPSSSHSTPASSPKLMTSSSPPCASDTWDDSTSASEVDEAESLRLWSSFSCSSDPYSPFNFQAPLRTEGPGKADWVKSKSKKASQPLSHAPHHNATSPPEYRKEDAEERLDSGFSEHCNTTQSCASTKKVRFCDDVEEFFMSCSEEEDRRGPWEELARDRCRFLRRCQEVEQSIAYCLQPQHRSRVYRRLAVLYVQDA